ncbi:uncharacterized protein LOC116262809 [Nymphaea colorata]|nr:uncharacterized protein LOC116262809 [Nymphaea colorata]
MSREMRETKVESWGLSMSVKAKNFDFKLKLSRFVGGQSFGDAHDVPPKTSLLQKIRGCLAKLKMSVKRSVRRGIASRTEGRTPPRDVSKTAKGTRFWLLNQVERSPEISNSQFLPSSVDMKVAGTIILYTVKGVIYFLLLSKSVLTRICPRPISLSASLISLLGFIIYFLGCRHDISHGVSRAWLESIVPRKLYLFT